MAENRILIVDDDPGLRLLYERELESAGFAVSTAGSAEEALKAVAEESIDLILLDIEMPETSGLEALHALRESAPEIRVVLNSAYSVYKSDFQTWLADDFNVKSSDLEPLKAKIRKLLEIE